MLGYPKVMSFSPVHFSEMTPFLYSGNLWDFFHGFKHIKSALKMEFKLEMLLLHIFFHLGEMYVIYNPMP